MGSEFSVVLANIFLTMLEIETIDLCLRNPLFTAPLYYRRYIDDLFAIFTNLFSAKFFMKIFSSRRNSIKFEGGDIGPSGIMLDMKIYKGPRFAATGVFDITIYQKEANKYLYIPYFSFHPKENFISFILSEINRYGLCCTNDSDFQAVKILFYQRLIDRAYPIDFLEPLFNNNPTRQMLLNKLIIPKPLKQTPLIFKTTYNPRLALLNLQNCLKVPTELLQDQDLSSIFGRYPMLCLKRPKNIGDLVKSSKYPFNILPENLTNPIDPAHLSTKLLLNTLSKEATRP